MIRARFGGIVQTTLYTPPAAATIRLLRCFVLIFCVLAMNIANTGAAQDVLVVVHVPSDTPPGDSIYLAGSLEGVGGWKPDGVKMAPGDDGTYSAKIALDVGRKLEFKITRGTWDTVEKSADGSEIANRPVSIDATTKRIEVTVQRWAGGTAQRPSTVVGSLKLHKIDSTFLKEPRTIRVWLPPGYDTDTNARYPVLYMHDGQNCFDRATSALGDEWEVDETLTKLIAEKFIPPLIVVAIDNGLGKRLDEYTYVADARRGGGHGAVHEKFLLGEVKPFVEKVYRVRDDKAHTFIGGSSLGGLNSLELARRNPDIFGGVLAMSPTVFWGDHALLKAIEKDPGGLGKTRIWLDMGSSELANPTAAELNESYVEEVRRLSDALERQHVEHHLEIDKDGRHNEAAWARRFPGAIKFLLKFD